MLSVRRFIDPRDDLSPSPNKPPAGTAIEPDELAELHRLSREGRLYDVERWIRVSRPVQIAQGTPSKRARVTSALDIAVQAGNHALVLLLLSNGYDPNQELRCPLDLARRGSFSDCVAALRLKTKMLKDWALDGGYDVWWQFADLRTEALAAAVQAERENLPQTVKDAAFAFLETAYRHGRVGDDKWLQELATAMDNLLAAPRA